MTNDINEIGTLDLCSTKERHLVEHVVRRFHRPAPDVFPDVSEGSFTTEVLEWEGKRVTNVPTELDTVGVVMGRNPYDYTEFGDGVPNGDLYSDEELQRFIEILTRKIDTLGASLKAIYPRAKKQSEEVKQAQQWWKLKPLWKEAKQQMSNIRSLINESYVKRSLCYGELRARASESSPWLTPWMTSDLCGPANVAPEGRDEEWDSDLWGINARAHGGSLEARNSEVEELLAMQWQPMRCTALAPVRHQPKEVQLTSTVRKRRK